VSVLSLPQYLILVLLGMVLQTIWSPFRMHWMQPKQEGLVRLLQHFRQVSPMAIVVVYICKHIAGGE